MTDYYTSERNPLGDRRRWADMCRSGALPAVKVGRCWLVRREDWDTWWEARQAHREAPATIEDRLAKQMGVEVVR